MFQTFDESSATQEVSGRVAGLRNLLRKAKIDAFLVPRGDEHRGEYVAPASERLKWLTAFSGSAGFAVVGLDGAALFVDGRYTVQAPQQTDTRVFEILQTPKARVADWLTEHFPVNAVIGYDPWLHSIGEIDELTSTLNAHGIKLKALAANPIDRLWGDERPEPPANPIVMHPENLAGKSATDKLADVQSTLGADGQDFALLTLPDSICWLLNIRGSDIPHTPTVLAFALVPRRGKVELFVDGSRADPETATHLKTVAKLLKPDRLKERLAALKAGEKKVRLSKAQTAQWFLKQLGQRGISYGSDPCVLAKAIKNAAEVEGTRAAHKRDAVAMCRFLAWFDAHAPSGQLDEITAARKLEAFRTETNQLKELSFDTISGTGPNGAVVHYRVNLDTNRPIRQGDLFLVDSGAQYADGTTDITRTIAVGAPTADMRRHFTLVLKGHIAIARARFPIGTRGLDLDPFARQALWQHGLDFDHGTGHGVGSYLSVHEGPQSISRRGDTLLEPGMIISNEPGFYKEGAYGIRIENLVLVKPPEAIEDGDREMLSFETLTFAPIDRRMIDTQLLDRAETDWLNSYHARVFGVAGTELEREERNWLRDATRPLD